MWFLSARTFSSVDFARTRDWDAIRFSKWSQWVSSPPLSAFPIPSPERIIVPWLPVCSMIADRLTSQIYGEFSWKPCWALITVPLWPFSDYNRNYTSATADINKAVVGDGVKRAMWQLFLAFIVKFVLSIMSIGMKVKLHSAAGNFPDAVTFSQIPAGLFIPNMLVGAIVGRMLGVGMEQLSTWVSTGYAGDPKNWMKNKFDNRSNRTVNRRPSRKTPPSLIWNLSNWKIKPISNKLPTPSIYFNENKKSKNITLR